MTGQARRSGPRLLLAGHHELASKALAAILDSGLTATYVAESSPAEDRGESLDAVGTRYGIRPVADTGDVPLEGAVRAFRPDILLSCGYRRILRKAVLDLVEYPINVHFGALPEYRGSWSIPHAVLRGDGRVGVTLHRMTPGIDDGPIYAQTILPDHGDLSCKDLYLQAVDAGVDLVMNFLGQSRNGAIAAPVPQGEDRATYFGTAYPNDFRIDWRATALQVCRYIRASFFPPYLPAHSEIDALSRVHFHWPVRPVYEPHAHPTGTVVALSGGALGVAVLNGFIVPGLVDVDGARAPFGSLAVERGWIDLRFGQFKK